MDEIRAIVDDVGLEKAVHHEVFYKDVPVELGEDWRTASQALDRINSVLQAVEE